MSTAFLKHGLRMHFQGLLIFNSLSLGFDLIAKLEKISLFSLPAACRLLFPEISYRQKKSVCLSCPVFSFPTSSSSPQISS